MRLQLLHENRWKCSEGWKKLGVAGEMQSLFENCKASCKKNQGVTDLRLLPAKMARARQKLSVHDSVQCGLKNGMLKVRM
tara:strand:- start:183 stop:422 length:240 start_codon:yes stop_codon:yes gene_type:complete